MKILLQYRHIILYFIKWHLEIKNNHEYAYTKAIITMFLCETNFLSVNEQKYFK